MKIHLTGLFRDKESEEYKEIEKRTEFSTDDLACIYKDGRGVYLLKKNGILMKVKHSLEDMEAYFLGSMYVKEVSGK